MLLGGKPRVSSQTDLKLILQSLDWPTNVELQKSRNLFDCLRPLQNAFQPLTSCAPTAGMSGLRTIGGQVYCLPNKLL